MLFRLHIAQPRRLAAAGALAGALALGGCQNDAQTGTAIGAGIGAIAGQAIGGDTEGTLIGTAVGAGAGYIIGNERDKAQARRERERDDGYAVRSPREPASGAEAPTTQERTAREAPAPERSPAADHPLMGTTWRVLSIAGDRAPEEYASIVVSFKSAENVTTYTTYRDGEMETVNERYEVRGDQIHIYGEGYTIEASYTLSDDRLVLSAPEFRAVMERLSE